MGSELSHMLPDNPTLIGSFLIGLGLGAVYFIGLWLTVRQLPNIQHPSAFIFASFFGRSAITLVGFTLVGKWHWSGILISLLGFLIMRMLVIRQVKSRIKTGITREESEIGIKS